MANLKIIVAVFLMTALLMTYSPRALSQQAMNMENVMVNGGFEQGFQPDYGIGYGWGRFSNGAANGSWNADNGIETVVAGRYSQLIKIENATQADRYVGIYQTVSVVPAQQYKLTIKGLIRSQEGSTKISHYGYGLQYAIDYDGGVVWEVMKPNEWEAIFWNEQPLQTAGGSSTYHFDTYETTITAKGDKLTLFIRGWKKWADKSAGGFNLDEISLVGPMGSVPQTTNQTIEPSKVVETKATELKKEIPEPTAVTPAKPSELPVSGKGNDKAFIYLVWASMILLLVLFGSAVATVKRRV